MKIRISTFLLLFTIVSLAILIFVQNYSFENKLSDLQLAHEQQLKTELIGLPVAARANTLINMKGSSGSELIPLERNLEVRMVVAVVDLYRNAEPINQSEELIANYGEPPAQILVANLLVQLECDKPSDFLDRYANREGIVTWEPEFVEFMSTINDVLDRK